MNKFDVISIPAAILLGLISYFSSDIFIQFAAGLLLILIFVLNTIMDSFTHPNR